MSDPASPGARFLAALAAPAAAPPALDDRLRALWQDARAAWPGVDVALDDYVAALAARRPPDLDVAAWLDEACAADLYLAAACAARLPAALAAFEARYLAKVPP